jgi:glycosyltransferase involved in cell wall biosynthesis
MAPLGVPGGSSRHRGRAVRREVVFVSGKDPIEESGGGHSTYVRAHGYAAIRAGFLPHIFGVGREGADVETDYGIVHRVRSPFAWLRQGRGTGYRSPLAPLHYPVTAAAVTTFLRSRPGPHLIHSFAMWGHAGVLASRTLASHGIEAVPICSAYTSYAHELHGRMAALQWNREPLRSARIAGEVLWGLALVARREGRAYRDSRLVLINYEAVRRILDADFGQGIRLRKIPYASETAFTRTAFDTPQPEPIASLAPADAPLVVAVSRHDPRKGIDTLIAALASLKSAGVRFRACLAGGGMLLESHRRLAQHRGLGAETAIVDFVPDSFAYLAHADVFVLPSREEGGGSLSLLEALQAGAAVVASNVDGIPEDISDGDNGLLFPPGDSSALARTLAQLLGEEQTRHRLARRARETFEARFSAPAFARALGEIYGELGFHPDDPLPRENARQIPAARARRSRRMRGSA